ncbi:MAG: IS91 family transposase, partial [Sulfitobacter sp.]|nr:IS91 family transposase [Sulfitobacter sp.]
MSQWLERQRDKLLPVDYFLVTFTLPEQLRSLAWKHQRKVYAALFRAASQTLK